MFRLLLLLFFLLKKLLANKNALKDKKEQECVFIKKTIDYDFYVFLVEK
jgi:hypothetical protein